MSVASDPSLFSHHSSPYNSGRDRSTAANRPAAAGADRSERPPDLHGQAGGVGPSSEADAAAADPRAWEAGADQDRAAQTDRLGADAAAGAQPRAEGEVRRLAVGRLRLRRAGRGALPRQPLHA